MGGEAQIHLLNVGLPQQVRFAVKSPTPEVKLGSIGG
jgi:hypothetical protein